MTRADPDEGPDEWPDEWPNEWVAELKPGEPWEMSHRQFGPKERNEWPYFWPFKAHPGQYPPPGDWSVWLIMAGRGFGKTRAGAEWVRWVAEADPSARIALVAATLGEARSVMVEGESGILACSPPHRRPSFEPSLRRVTWPAGAEATLYSALEAEALRGPQHSHASRPDAEGGLRQRSPCAGRRAAAPGDRGRGRRAAADAGRRRELAGRCRGDR